MSASREKKIRQQLAASGTPDPKKVRQEEELRKQRKSNRLYGAVAVLFVVVAALLVLWNSNVIQRGTAAVTVDGVKYSAAEVDYQYYSIYNNLANSDYASYMGLGGYIDRHTTQMGDTAKMLLGVEEDMTWDAYLKDQAIEGLTKLTKVSALAQQAGYTFTPEMQKSLDRSLTSLKEGAQTAGMSQNAYLKAVYGSNMTLSTYKSMYQRAMIASAYERDHVNGFTYTDEEIETYYQENQNSLDVASYETILFNGSAPSTTDDDGHTVEATDEEKEAAKTAAHEAAQEALDRYNAGESLEDIAKSYDIATYANRENSTDSSSAVGQWAFDAERKEGDAAVVDSDPSCYLVLFHSRQRNEDRTVDVRHILFRADTSALDKDAEDYDMQLADIQAETKTKAEDTLARWQSGEATEDSFAALANELSEDDGSNTNGGLYEAVAQGQMVPAFDEWIFAEGRQAGDTGVVETSFGYHVMYFVGDNLPMWKLQATNALRETDHNEWVEELLADAAATQTSGMKYVG